MQPIIRKISLSSIDKVQSLRAIMEAQQETARNAIRTAENIQKQIETLVINKYSPIQVGDMVRDDTGHLFKVRTVTFEESPNQIDFYYRGYPAHVTGSGFSDQDVLLDHPQRVIPTL